MFTALTNNDERLYIAVYCGNHDLAQQLLLEGANPNTLHGCQQVPLISIAVYMGDVKMLELLLTHHADPNITDKGGNTCLHIIASERRQDATQY